MSEFLDLLKSFNIEIEKPVHGKNKPVTQDLDKNEYRKMRRDMINDNKKFQSESKKINRNTGQLTSVHEMCDLPDINSKYLNIDPNTVTSKELRKKMSNAVINRKIELQKIEKKLREIEYNTLVDAQKIPNEDEKDLIRKSVDNPVDYDEDRDATVAGLKITTAKFKDHIKELYPNRKTVLISENILSKEIMDAVEETQKSNKLETGEDLFV